MRPFDLLLMASPDVISHVFLNSFVLFEYLDNCFAEMFNCLANSANVVVKIVE